MWKVMDKLNKVAQTAHKWWRPILRFEKGANIVDQYISRSPAPLESKWRRTVKYAGIIEGTLKHLICVRVSVTCSFHTFTTTRIFIRP
jgi:hypothetical protein